jgi:hypothetical protein
MNNMIIYLYRYIDWNVALQKTLGVILSLGIITGCVIVISGFLAAKRDGARLPQPALRELIC